MAQNKTTILLMTIMLLAVNANALVVINEVLPDPQTDWNGNGKIESYNDEWIELYNTGAGQDISGWFIGDEANPKKYQIPADTTIGSGEFLVFYGSETAVRLNNGGETIYLHDNSEALIGSLTYDEAVGKDNSTGRIPDGTESIQTLCTPTPLASNSQGGCQKDSTTTTSTTATTTSQPTTTIGQTTTSTTTIDTTTTTTSTTSSTTSTTLDLDCRLVITEIMADPQATGDSDGEYVELYNTGGDCNLNGLVLKDRGSDSHVIAEDVEVSPNQYVLLCKNANPFENGGVECDYEYSGFTLANTEDEVIIASGETVIDEVAYDGEFPLKPGKSMNLDKSKTSAILNNDPKNWCESTDTITSGDFGTPGAQNTRCTGDTTTSTTSSTSIVDSTTTTLKTSTATYSRLGGGGPAQTTVKQTTTTKTNPTTTTVKKQGEPQKQESEAKTTTTKTNPTTTLVKRVLETPAGLAVAGDGKSYWKPALVILLVLGALALLAGKGGGK